MFTALACTRPTRSAKGEAFHVTLRRHASAHHGAPPLCSQVSEGRGPPTSPTGTELRAISKDVALHSVRIAGTQRQREGGHGHEYVTYLVDSVLLVHGVQTMLRSERRYVDGH